MDLGDKVAVAVRTSPICRTQFSKGSKVIPDGIPKGQEGAFGKRERRDIVGSNRRRYNSTAETDEFRYFLVKGVSRVGKRHRYTRTHETHETQGREYHPCAETGEKLQLDCHNMEGEGNAPGRSPKDTITAISNPQFVGFVS
jgi:hypothetical protein